jgi:predicted DNA-binding protein (UPF0251 family)
MTRRIHGQPSVRFYKPQGVPLGLLRGVTLPLEGLEAIRLADAEGLDQERAAAMMDISRSTFSRLVAEARHTVAQALTNGWAIRIEGGHYEMADGRTPEGAALRRCRKGRGRGGGCRRHGALSRTATLECDPGPDE